MAKKIFNEVERALHHFRLEEKLQRSATSKHFAKMCGQISKMAELVKVSRSLINGSKQRKKDHVARS